MNKQKTTFKGLLYFAVFLFVGFSFVACEKTQDEPVATAKEQQELTPVAYANSQFAHNSEWYSYPSWETRPFGVKSFFVKKTKVLLVVTNTGKTRLRIDGVWNKASANQVSFFLDPGRVNSIVLSDYEIESNNFTVKVYSGEGNGDFVRGKCYVYVSYWR